MYKVTFKNSDTEAMKLTTVYIGRRQRAEEQVIIHEIPYSDNVEIEHTGSYKPYEREMEFHVQDKSKVREINTWLTGYGILRTDLDVGGFFKAHAMGQLEYEKMFQVEDQIKARFLVSPPFFYLDSGETVITKTTKPTTVTNPGTIYSEPLIIVYGWDTINLEINGNNITLTNVSGSIYIDSEAGYVYSGTTNRGDDMVGDFPVLETGVNNITWTGTVSGIDITPRWREL